MIVALAVLEMKLSMMERINLPGCTGYKATEAAIHMARYMLAYPYCQNAMRVLDAACGEGYGSWFMKKAGASRVDGVDISSKAILTAQKLFKEKGLTFQRLDVEKLDETFPKNTFDLVVSIETIEHLREPEKFLRALKKVIKKNAIIIITCPNDHWYYPKKGQSNPHHVRKYTFREFREMTSDILGGNATWGFGAPLIGFGNISEEVASWGYSNSQLQMLEGTLQEGSLLLPPDHSDKPEMSNCSYFFGIWNNGVQEHASSAIFPMTMDRYSRLLAWENASGTPDELTKLQETNNRLQASLDQTRRDISSKLATLEREREELLSRLNEKEREAEAHRVRALALEREQSVTQAQVQALQQQLEKERAEAEAKLAVLENENKALVNRVQEHFDRRLTLRIARRIKPFVPGPLWRLMRKIAYRLKILS